MTRRDFANALVAWREGNDNTQKQVAEMPGVSRRSLENWEQELALPQGFGLKAMLDFIEAPKAAVKPKRKCD